MTLVQTMFAVDGIYQSSDHRLSLSGRPIDNEAVKHVAVVCADGAALISFVGLAKTADRRHLVNWLVSQAIGPVRTVEETFDAIGERAVQDFGQSVHRHEQLTIVAGATTQAGWFYTEIGNLWKDRATGKNVVRPDFHRQTWAVDSYRIYPRGSGVAHVSKTDRTKLLLCCTQKPRTPDDYMRLLAAVHRRTARVARSSGDDSVNGSCYTAFMPDPIWPIRGRSWQDAVPPISRDMRPVPLIIGGEDATSTIWSLTGPARAGGTMAGFQFIFAPEGLLDGPDPDAGRRTRRSRRRYARGI